MDDGFLRECSSLLLLCCSWVMIRIAVLDEYGTERERRWGGRVVRAEERRTNGRGAG